MRFRPQSVYFAIISYAVVVTIVLGYVLAHNAGRVTIAAPRAIPEANWHYHILLPDQIADVCSAFVDQRGHQGLPLACVFKNFIKNECHLFLAPASPGALFALQYEERRCRGLEQ